MAAIKETATTDHSNIIFDGAGFCRIVVNFDGAGCRCSGSGMAPVAVSTAVDAVVVIIWPDNLASCMTCSTIIDLLHPGTLFSFASSPGQNKTLDMTCPIKLQADCPVPPLLP